MLLADMFGEGILNLILIFGVFGIVAKAFLRKHDPDGEIGKAATKGAASWISRMFK
jgi:hypothetical protein